MRAGQVEQIATPRAIYERPETPFVASFVGTTNLLDGVIRGRDGDTAAIAFAGTTMRADGVRGNVGNNVTVSLRPETLRLLGAGEAAPAGWATFAGTLGEIEYLGPVTRFRVQLADTSLHLMALAPPVVS